METKCIFNFPVRQWDLVSGELRGLMGTYTIIGIIKELQIVPTVQSEGHNEIPERTPSTYMANVLLRYSIRSKHYLSNLLIACWQSCGYRLNLYVILRFSFSFGFRTPVYEAFNLVLSKIKIYTGCLCVCNPVW